jgi:hypothetical protein
MSDLDPQVALASFRAPPSAADAVAYAPAEAGPAGLARMSAMLVLNSVLDDGREPASGPEDPAIHGPMGARRELLEWCAGIIIICALVLTGFALPYM